MSLTIHQHIRKSVLKTALMRMLKNGQKSPERTARNVLELLVKFNPASADLFDYSSLSSLIKTTSREECLDIILKKLS